MVSCLLFMAIYALSLVNGANECTKGYPGTQWHCSKVTFNKVPVYQWLCCAPQGTACSDYDDTDKDNWKLNHPSINLKGVQLTVHKTKALTLWNTASCPSSKLCKFKIDETGQPDFWHVTACNNGKWGNSEYHHGFVKPTKELKNKKEKYKSKKVKLDNKVGAIESYTGSETSQGLNNKHKKAYQSTKGKNTNLQQLTDEWKKNMKTKKQDKAYKAYDNIFDAQYIPSSYTTSSYPSYYASYYPIYLMCVILIIMAVCCGFIAGIIGGYLCATYWTIKY